MGITFKEIGDDCELCPLHKEGLCNGLVNNGNGPVYPPCSEMDEDTDVEAYLADRKERERRAALQREQSVKEKAEAKKKAELKKRRRQFSDRYCCSEINRVKVLKKALAAADKAADSVEFDLRFSEAMAEGGIMLGNLENLTASLAGIREKKAFLQLELKKAGDELLKKRKEAQATEGYQSIR